MMRRAEAITTLVRHLDPKDLLLSTTGFISREVFNAGDRPSNFYMLGSMGLVTSVAFGLALLENGRRVFVIEGDGSALMNLGTLALIGAERPGNLVHVILDNEAYESTGGQPSITSRVDLAEVAKSCGYREVVRCQEPGTLATAVSRARLDEGPYLLVVKTDLAGSSDVPRVSRSPAEIRDTFCRVVQGRS